MKIVKAISKQLLGAHYEHIKQSVFICLILYFALSAAEIKVTIAPFILYLTAIFFTAGVMWQALCSSQNADKMGGLFMLPFDNKRLTFSYVIAFSLYTLLTKTSVVLSLFFAVGNWSMCQVLIAILCACNSCIVSAVCYSMIEQRRGIYALLWIAGLILSIFMVRQQGVFLCLITLSFVLALLYLCFIDAYIFYHHVSAKIIAKHKGKAGSIFIYLIRYLMANKSYLINTLGLLGIAVFLPLLLGQFNGLNIMPLGFAILCLNTPICILLSSDPELEQAVRTLPGQVRLFCIRYCVFIFCANASVMLVYLFSWHFQNGGITSWEVLAGLLFSAQSAIFSVLLEWLHPIRNWKIENDLWHHPRKYIVPLVMMLTAVIVSAWPVMVILWLGTIVVEIIGILLTVRRI